MDIDPYKPLSSASVSPHDCEECCAEAGSICYFYCANRQRREEAAVSAYEQLCSQLIDTKAKLKQVTDQRNAYRVLLRTFVGMGDGGCGCGEGYHIAEEIKKWFPELR